jgi:mRNA interferase RelE/StbE
MYEVIFDEEAIDFLSKLPKELKKRIYNKIISTKENPFRFFNKLTDRKDYKLRVSDYRVIANINKNENKIQITIIGHRKNVYKNQ